MAATAAEPYKHGPDSERQPGVPQGKVSKFTHTSKVFPDTVRAAVLDGAGLGLEPVEVDHVALERNDLWRLGRLLAAKHMAGVHEQEGLPVALDDVAALGE